MLGEGWLDVWETLNPRSTLKPLGAWKHCVPRFPGPLRWWHHENNCTRRHRHRPSLHFSHWTLAKVAGGQRKEGGMGQVTRLHTALPPPKPLSTTARSWPSHPLSLHHEDPKSSAYQEPRVSISLCISPAVLWLHSCSASLQCAYQTGMAASSPEFQVTYAQWHSPLIYWYHKYFHLPRLSTPGLSREGTIFKIPHSAPWVKRPAVW